MQNDCSVPVVSVLLAAHNEELWIRRCLESLHAQATDEPFEIVVIDNDSGDRTLDLAKGHADVVVSCVERGRLRALKEGLRYSRGKIIAFADADTCYPQSWIANLVSAFRTNAAAKVVFGPSTQGLRRPKVIRAMLTLYSLWVEASLRAGAVPSVGFNMAVSRDAAEVVLPTIPDYAFHDWAIGTAVMSQWGRTSAVYARDLVVPKSMRRYRMRGWWKTSAVATAEWWRLANGRVLTLLENEYHGF